MDERKYFTAGTKPTIMSGISLLSVGVKHAIGVTQRVGKWGHGHKVLFFITCLDMDLTCPNDTTLLRYQEEIFGPVSVISDVADKRP